MSSPARKLVVLGLSLSSSWGNGHATTWRALLAAMAELGWEITFFERDTPWYAAHRDLTDPAYCRLVLYPDLPALEGYRDEIASADAVVVGSYVPEGIAVGDLVTRTARGVTLFYDIDTPVTLAGLADGTCTYLAPRQIAEYDGYLSFTGGPTLRRLVAVHGARAARALYCSVDPARYRPLDVPRRWDLGFLGTYSPDRQAGLERLLIEPARRAPHLRFVVAGSQFPASIDWPPNVERIEHLPPCDHPAFYSSLGWSLNLTRAAMIAAGFSPSVRLFEAAACNVPLISDRWHGMEEALRPGAEILVADSSDDVLATLALPASQRARIARQARTRVLVEHTAHSRARQFEAAIDEACAGRPGQLALVRNGVHQELTLRSAS
jgi:spore maturation protein CgeB